MILRRFESSDRLIGIYDLVRGVLDPRPAKTVGFDPDYVSHEAAATEAIWQEVESRVPAALAEIDQNPLELSQATASTVKDLVALHFARSRATATGHADARIEAETKLRLDQATLARLASARHNGLHLDHAPSVLAEIADEVIAGVREEEAQVFREDVVRYFQITRTNFSAYTLMVRPVVSEAELLLGDCPAVSVAPGMSPMKRAPLFDAAFIAMPLGPRSAAFVYPDGIDEPVVPLGPDEATHLNRSQIALSQRQVYYRTGSGLEQEAYSLRPPLRFS